MSLTYAIANGLMRTAARLAPKGRADWAEAMRAELAAVEDGGAALGWAAGCLATVLGWRLLGEATFFLLVLAVAAMLTLVVEPAVMMALPNGFLHANAYLIFLLLPALAAGTIGAARPGRVWYAALGTAVLSDVISELAFYLAFGHFITGSQGWTVMDAPPLVGYAALLGATYIGASEGARLRRRFAR